MPNGVEYLIDPATGKLVLTTTGGTVTSPIVSGAANAAGGSALSGLLGPLSLFTSIKGLGDYIVAGNKADRAKREAEYRQAMADMANAGFDFSVYSPEYLQASLDAAGWAVPGLDVNQLSAQMIGDVISRYILNPSSIIVDGPRQTEEGNWTTGDTEIESGSPVIPGADVGTPGIVQTEYPVGGAGSSGPSGSNPNTAPNQSEINWELVISDWLRRFPDATQEDIAEAIEDYNIPEEAVRSAGYNMDGSPAAMPDINDPASGAVDPVLQEHPWTYSNGTLTNIFTGEVIEAPEGPAYVEGGQYSRGEPSMGDSDVPGNIVTEPTDAIDWDVVIADWLRRFPDATQEDIAGAIEDYDIPQEAVNNAGYNMDGSQIGATPDGTEVTLGTGGGTIIDETPFVPGDAGDNVLGTGGGTVINETPTTDTPVDIPEEVTLGTGGGEIIDETPDLGTGTDTGTDLGGDTGGGDDTGTDDGTGDTIVTPPPPPPPVVTPPPEVPEIVTEPDGEIPVFGGYPAVDPVYGYELTQLLNRYGLQSPTLPRRGGLSAENYQAVVDQYMNRISSTPQYDTPISGESYRNLLSNSLYGNPGSNLPAQQLPHAIIPQPVAPSPRAPVSVQNGQQTEGSPPYNMPGISAADYGSATQVSPNEFVTSGGQQIFADDYGRALPEINNGQMVGAPTGSVVQEGPWQDMALSSGETPIQAWYRANREQSWATGADADRNWTLFANHRGITPSQLAGVLGRSEADIKSMYNQYIPTANYAEGGLVRSISSYQQGGMVAPPEDALDPILRRYQQNQAMPNIDQSMAVLRDVAAARKAAIEAANVPMQGPSDSDKWLRLAAAFANPGRTGNFMEGLGNAAGVLSEHNAAVRDFTAADADRQLQAKLAALGVDQGLAEAELNLGMESQRRSDQQLADLLRYYQGEKDRAAEQAGRYRDLDTIAESYRRAQEARSMGNEELASIYESAYRKPADDFSDRQKESVRFLQSQHKSYTDLAKSALENNDMANAELYMGLADETAEQISSILGSSQKPSGLDVGAVVDGYEFIGGDPNNPNSWREVTASMP